MKNQLLQETAAGLAMATAFTDGDFKGMSIILNTEITMKTMSAPTKW